MGSVNKNLVAAAVIGLVVLYFYKDIKKSFTAEPWNTGTTISAIQSAGGTVSSTSTGDFINIPGGVAKITDGWDPNFAQRALIGLDKIIPGDWLTRKVLGL